MIGTVTVLPGTINNLDLPTYTANADYDAIAALPGLLHYIDWTQVVTASPLSVSDLAADVLYSRSSGYAGNPTIGALNGKPALVVTAAASRIESADNINWGIDWTLAFACERTAGSGNNILCSFGTGGASPNGQVYFNGVSGTVTVFASITHSWTNGNFGGGAAVAAGEKAALMFAYKASIQTLTLYFNGALIGSATVNNQLTANKPCMALGDATNTQKFGDVFLFSVALGDADKSDTRDFVNNYLKAKYAIA